MLPFILDSGNFMLYIYNIKIDISHKGGGIMNQEAKKQKTSGVMKRITSTNPFRYLGWLGCLGILGIFFIPAFIPFLLCFSFFAYGGMKPDELFWENVRRASTRAFWTVFIIDTVWMFWLFVRGMTFSYGDGTYIETVIEERTVTMGIFSFDQMMLMTFLLILNLALMIFIFSISMLRFRRQEKKMLEA